MPRPTPLIRQLSLESFTRAVLQNEPNLVRGERSSAPEFYQRYTLVGEDPFVVAIDGAGPDLEFSAWDYARERSEVMCRPESLSRK
jgi:hypothetical protein